MEFLRDINRSDLNPSVKSAVITAGVNFISAKEKKYPWEILNLEMPERIRTSFTIGIDSPEKMLESIRLCRYPIIKLKFGFGDEKEIARQLSDFPDKLFRIDANGAWTPEKAEEMFFYFRQANVEIVEQPTDFDKVKEWKYLKGKGNFHITIDEGLNSIEDFYNFADYVDCINIKMARVGGILKAVEIAQKSKDSGLKIMLGCMVESSIGIAPALYMGSMADYFDLDGPLLLENDISDDIKYEGDEVVISKSIIGGPRIKKGIIP